MLRYFLIILAIYLLTRFIFGFVIPVVVAGLNMRRKMKEMQNNINGFQNKQQSTNYSDKTTSNAQSSSKASSSDYIDFEEIK